MLDHWDNLDGSIERGYAGRSLWRWDELPDTVVAAHARLRARQRVDRHQRGRAEQRQRQRADPDAGHPAQGGGAGRRVPALGDPRLSLRALERADRARRRSPPPIRATRPSPPGGATKVDEIYALVPDFGGFLVKANSEGQPGPQDYGRTHADGANMLADALAPHKGVVIWRAFVYKADVAEDRAKQAYAELVPLDGSFRPNVKLQVKNGPIDFQPREPFHPLFGAMPRTQTMLELQLTQEYLGQGTHLAYLAPLFKETLDADTYADGPQTTVAHIVDGSVMAAGVGHLFCGIAAVANIGDDRNWCGHPFAQANWYAFGRLAWDHRPRRRRHRRRMDPDDVHVRRALRRAGQRR